MPKVKEEFDELICGSYICAKKNSSIKINEKKVKSIFKAKITPFKKSGGFISAPQKYGNHQVYVVVMEDKTDE